jgi:D-alanyl-D-alanine carboxypeptidase
VVLGGTSGASRDAHTADLLNAGFSVLARRGRGESITLASMFPEEAPQALASVRGSVEQGDTEPTKPSRSEAVQLAQAVTPRVNARLRGLQEVAAEEAKTRKGVAEEDAKPAKGKGRTAAKADADEDAPAKPKTGGWYVQVGAFPSEDAASDRVKDVAKKYARLFRGAEGRVQKSAAGAHWRARFHGLDADEAKAACKALEAKKEPCLAVRS